ncbi:hypothetical protein FACS189499_10610 [Clostridia bacterium]|nr:hypothetical protein FACS189499_10610 [Clostridia bacterium]
MTVTSILKTTFRRAAGSYIGVYSAQAAFYIIMSFFPFVMLFLSLLKYLPGTSLHIQMFIGDRADFFPENVSAVLENVFLEIYSGSSVPVMSVATVGALWAASKGFMAIIGGLNYVYSVSEKRNWFTLRLVSVIYTLGLIALLTVLVLLGLSHMNTMFMFLILIILFLLLYTVIPDRKTKPQNELPGAIISASGFVIFSRCYSYYIENFPNDSAIYGSLAAVVFLMLWLYFCMYILFVGAVFNDVLSEDDMA